MAKQENQEENMRIYLKKHKKLFEINNFIKIFEKNIKDILLFKDESLAEQIVAIKEYKENVNNGDLVNRRIFMDLLKTVFLKDFALYNIEEDGTLEDKPFLMGLEFSKYKDVIDWVLPFETPEKLSSKDKFEIILYKNKEINSLGYDRAFYKIKNKYPIYKKSHRDSDGFINIWYEYTDKDIEEIYQKENIQLDFNGKVDVIIQRISEELYGLKHIDILAHSSINEVGFQNNGKYIYAWCDEKIHLSFLKMTESQAEVVQRKLTKYSEKGKQLDTNNPEISTHRKDKARITVTQSPYSSSRVLRIRIFDKSDCGFDDLVTDRKLKFLVKSLMKIGLTIAIQGELGAGKSTMMSVLMEILDDKEQIVTLEDILEQYNSLKYGNKSIVELQTTEKKNLLDALSTLLRLSADVAALGEVRDGEALFVLVQLAQAIGKTVLFTTHMASPEDYIPRGKNMLIATGKYFTEQAAVFDLVNYTNIIFQLESIDDKRYISKIVEIVPLVEKSSVQKIGIDTPMEELQKLAYIQQIQQNPANMYMLNTLLELEGGEYKFKNLPSDKFIQRANKNKETKKYIDNLIEYMKQDVALCNGGEVHCK